MQADNRTIQAYADSDERLHCMKCQRLLHTKDVAMFIRSNPTDAFNAWCPRCTYDIVKLAADAAGLGDYEPIIVAF